MPNGDYKTFLSRILEIAVSNDVSDVHISAGRHPILRMDGRLTPIDDLPILKPEDTIGLADVILSEERKEQFLKQRDIDTSFEYEDKARFRVNIYHQLGKVSIALRLIPTKVRSIKELFLPEACYNFAKASQGFLLVVGPAGQGKSTAMASIVNEINHTRQDHIITIEDPVEYLFEQDKCIIDQREVGEDVTDFNRGLREALRQDPDVVMIGEMRDTETISSAVTAAETGHLVLATLHTNNAAQTIDRIIDSFPPHQQNQIRMQLASNILGIISRRLLPKKGGGRINAIELMIANHAIRNLIREGKIHQIGMVIETSLDFGMVSLNHSLANLVSQGLVELVDAEAQSNNVSELLMLLKK